MNPTSGAKVSALLLAGLALAGCSQPTPVVVPAPPAPSVDAAVLQRVKNGCMKDLAVQASGAPQAGVLHPRKARLSNVSFLGGAKEVKLPGDLPGYELGIAFTYKLGNDDPRTGKKLCQINLGDSNVVWQSVK